MRRALCIGIDEYAFGPLSGCVSDAERVSAMMAKHHDGSPNFDCKTILAPRSGPRDSVTRAVVKREVEALFKSPAEVALLHFSGHGTVNNLDGYLVTQDAAVYDEGVAMGDILRMANDSRTEEVVVFLDCCHSGNLGNLPAVDNTKAMLREGVSILTASRGDQVSVEESGGGLFTSLVVDALDGGAADILGDVSAPAIYSYVEAALGAWDQRPLFKAHVAKVVSLRKCRPAVEPSILRSLPELFSVPAEDLPLSPEYENASGCSDPVKVAIFCKLQMLNRIHLVVPVGADHMYDAAMQGKACRLTPSGRYYWRLAVDHRI